MKIQKVYKLSIDDLNKGSEVLTEAFKNYPTFKYLFPDVDEREIKLEHVMRYFIKCGLYYGEVYAPSNDIEGVAIWYKNTGLGMKLPDLVRAGLVNLLLGLNLASFIKFKKMGDVKKYNREQLIKSEYYFLDVIGIAPVFERRGYGRFLIESKLEQIKEEKKCCFLETSNIENIEYYKKYGFDLISSYNYSGLQSFCMLKK